jgi:hypothetical protein
VQKITARYCYDLLALGSQLGGIGAIIVPVCAHIAGQFAKERTFGIIGTRSYKHQLDYKKSK